MGRWKELETAIPSHEIVSDYTYIRSVKKSLLLGYSHPYTYPLSTKMTDQKQCGSDKCKWMKSYLDIRPNPACLPGIEMTFILRSSCDGHIYELYQDRTLVAHI